MLSRQRQGEDNEDEAYLLSSVCFIRHWEDNTTGILQVLFLLAFRVILHVVLIHVLLNFIFTPLKINRNKQELLFSNFTMIRVLVSSLGNLILV